MQASIGESLPFSCFYTVDGEAAALLSVTADIFRNGVLLLDDESVAEVGRGVYRYVLDGSHVTANGDYHAVFNTTGDVDQIDLAAVWIVRTGTLGAIEYTYTLTEADLITPIAGATVKISTDNSGANVIWSGTTDEFGIARDNDTSAKPYLNAGTYYFWSYKSEYSFDNPDTEVVS